jgi:hypothetical protein
MKVSTGYNPYAYRQQAGRGHSSRFADVYANRAAARTHSSDKSGSTSGNVEVVGTPVSDGYGLMPFRLLLDKVDTSRQLNADSKGDAQLTKKQIESLREKYDLNNMSLQDQYDFYCDLTDMGVLSAADVDAIGMSHIRLKGDVGFHETSDSFITSKDEAYGNLYMWMAAVIKREKAGYDYMTELGDELEKNGHRYDESIHRGYGEFQDNLDIIEKMMVSHKKLAGVLGDLTIKRVNWNAAYVRGSDFRVRDLFVSKEYLKPRQPNTDSNGDQQLTGAQALYLQGRYDMENLSSQDRHSLLCDLTDMGVLSAADLEAEDQSKVEAVLAEIKAAKLGVGIEFEAPDQPEVELVQDGDHEYWGMTNEEKFEAIIKKYGKHMMTFDEFHDMVNSLIFNKVITVDQAHCLRDLEGGNMVVERTTLEDKQGYNFNGPLFYANYRITMSELISEYTRFKDFCMSVGQKFPDHYDLDYVKDFASKFEAILQGGAA